jgi:hypothetical protein
VAKAINETINNEGDAFMGPPVDNGESLAFLNEGFKWKDLIFGSIGDAK